MWIGNFDRASKSGESRKDDDQEDGKLDEAKEILQTKTPFERQAVNQECRSDACESHTSLVPAADFDVGGMEDVLSKDNGV